MVLMMNSATEDSSNIFGIEEVIVFHNENKIYYKHEPQVLSKVPFVVDAQVEEGENHFYILLRNKLGLTHTKHISYFYSLKRVYKINYRTQTLSNNWSQL